MILDLFAGPGGWSVALDRLGMSDLEVGIEWDRAACDTARAAGYHRAQQDVRHYQTSGRDAITGLIASPPCQTFSSAGRGAGRDHIAHLIHALDLVFMGLTSKEAIAQVHDDELDERSELVLEPARLIHSAHPRWVCLEQVPPVLPIWRRYAKHLRGRGYSVWCGILNAADYGVPQTRQRAILIASLDVKVAAPRVTHTKTGREPGMSKWVSMAQALGWRMDARPIMRSNYGTGGDPANRGQRSGDEPAPTVTSKIDRNIVMVNGNQDKSAVRPLDEPAPTILFGHRMNDVRWEVTDADNDERTRAKAHVRGMLSAGGNNTAGQRERPPEEPSATITGKGTAYWQRVVNQSGTPIDLDLMLDRPATTLAGRDLVPSPGANANRFNGATKSRNDGVRVTVQEAGLLQSFPADYPWDGLRPAPHVAQGLTIKDDDAFADQLVSDGLQRGVHFLVRGVPGENNKIAQAVVMLDAVDVVHDLTRLRMGDYAVLRYERPASEDVTSIDAKLGSLFPALICVERITVQAPLLPVLGTEAARDGFAFAVQARWLGSVAGPGVGSTALAHSLPVHEAQPFSPMRPVTSFDATFAHTSSYHPIGSTKTKQYEQVGNAIPPGLAYAILNVVVGDLPVTGVPHLDPKARARARAVLKAKARRVQ